MGISRKSGNGGAAGSDFAEKGTAGQAGSISLTIRPFANFQKIPEIYFSRFVRLSAFAA